MTVPLEGLSTGDDLPRFPRTQLVDFAASAFICGGLTPDDARAAATQLITADLRGVESHGLARLPGYVANLRKGTTSATARLTVERETPSAVSFNANNGVGLLLAPRAMARCIEKAQDTGLCMATVRNSNHFGIAGTYVRQATDAGLGGMAMTNAGAIVVPTYGTEPRLGTNPMALGVPTRRGYPLLIDMSTSTVAWGKIEIARRAHLPIPTGWGVDDRGLPVTDPMQLAGLTPLGSSPAMSSHKGYGLGLMVDVLCGPLAGNPSSPEISRLAGSKRGGSINTGHAFMAWRIDAFRDPDEFQDHLDSVMNELAETPVADGAPVDRVLIPGDPENIAEMANTAHGIPIRREVLEEIRAMCKEADLAFTLES
jgi:LDH2 family malate/lactate/ureidoglycolate dehydrogenase